MSAQLKCIPINHGWEFKEADRDDTFLPVSQFPTTNHLDLLHHGRIPDPTQDRNREAVQWVGERPWLYKTSFEYDEGGTPRAVLVFKGLDTHCSIVLNGELLLKTNDMFLEYTSEVTGKLKMGMNDLELRFESTFLVGKQLEKAQGFKNLFWNGDSSRMNVRKVPCHYGWDWGPTLMTCGPWRPISLLVYEARILDLSVDIEVSDGLDYAILTVQNEIEGGNNMRIEVSVKDASGTQVATRSLQGNATCRFTINSPVLWYPVGYGAQHLYMVEARLYGPSGESCLDFMSHKVGIRLLELVQRPIVGQSGSTFFFRVNNIPIYCQGTNWIPPDTFLPRMTAEKYREWLQLAVKSNQNMIRVWGGGLYEEDSFYDTCDELGILIWQDFMLGCGSYPVNDELLTAIKREAIYNVKRLRQHPCIVLWCGNNEDYMFAEIHKLEYDPQDQDPNSWLKSNWPARYYYEVILKDICKDLVPRVPYHFSSPWGGSYSNDPLIGDAHSWKVWMADQPRHPYQMYPQLSARFVSEFGMKSYPSIKTFKELISDKSERHPQSVTLDSWHMAPEDQRTLALYLIDNFKHDMTLESYVYTTQLLQAEAMSFAVLGWRRLWKGPGHEECAGNLIWQMNDCFPARNYAPLIVGIHRRLVETPQNEFTNVDVKRESFAEIWASNLTTKPIQAYLEVRMFGIDGKLLAEHSKSVDLAPNRSSELCLHEIPMAPQPVIVAARIRQGGETVARFVDWPQPLKYLDLESSGLEVRVSEDRVTVKSSRPIKGLELYVSDADVEFDDNCLDIVPSDPQIVKVRGLGASKISWKHLGSVS